MTPTQRAVINGVAAAGILVITFGVVLLVFDMNNIDEICKPYFLGSSDSYCVKEDANTRGIFIIVFGFIVMIAISVASGIISKAAKNAQG